MNRSALRATVILRDRGCQAARWDPRHVCRDKWGEEHHPEDLDRLTLEHVRPVAGGARLDEPGWCVAMCHHGNVVERWGSKGDNRRELNIYLAGVRNQASAA